MHFYLAFQKSWTIFCLYQKEAHIHFAKIVSITADEDAINVYIPVYHQHQPLVNDVFPSAEGDTVVQ